VSTDGPTAPESGSMPDPQPEGTAPEAGTHDAGAQEAGAQDVADPTRRQFFRRFAGEVMTGAAQVVGAVTELRDRSAAEASVLLGEPPKAAGTNGASAATAAVPTPAATGEEGVAAVFRTPFRFESDNVLLVIDQRKLPDQLLEVPVRTASDAASAIRLMVVRGAPAIGQVAAIGLAMTARIAAKSNPHTRRAIIDGAAGQIRTARPTAVNLGWAVDRLMARYRELGELSEDGAGIAAALHDE